MNHRIVMSEYETLLNHYNFRSHTLTHHLCMNYFLHCVIEALKKDNVSCCYPLLHYQLKSALAVELAKHSCSHCSSSNIHRANSTSSLPQNRLQEINNTANDFYNLIKTSNTLL